MTTTTEHDQATTGKIPNGVFTITNQETREHRTFRIHTKAESANFAPGERVVSLLEGPDNTSDYRGFGFVKGDRILVWKSKRGEGKRSAHEWYALMLADLFTGGEHFGDRYTIEGARVCRRCNRQLTDPDSIAAEMGPECRARVS
jgi:hypothetical protein